MHAQVAHIDQASVQRSRVACKYFNTTHLLLDSQGFSLHQLGCFVNCFVLGSAKNQNKTKTHNSADAQ